MAIKNIIETVGIVLGVIIVVCFVLIGILAISFGLFNNKTFIYSDDEEEYYGE